MSFAQPFRDYEILDRVGAGATGTVFKARQLRLGRVVALKLLRPSLARDVRYVERLRREARIVGSLNHPNIVTGYDLGEEGGYHFFVMEFVEGRSLRALLSEWGIFPEAEVRRVARQVAAALDHAFGKNVIHRDIKPGNILIDGAGNVKVTDMGLAKGPADLALTRDGSTIGTPQYIAPEQARNPQDADIRSDLYSLGATLYHMATGQPPFPGTTVAEVILRVLHETPVSPRVINPDLSEGMSLVIRKLLGKSPALRYQTPKELLEDLDRLDRDQRPQVDESRLVAGESGRSRLLSRWVVAAVLGIALAGGGFWLGSAGFHGVEAQPSQPGVCEEIDAELASIQSPGERWLRFLSKMRQQTEVPADWRQRRQRELTDALQVEVQSFVTRLREEDWARIAKVIDSPQAWPTGSALAEEHLSQSMRRSVGAPREQLPSGLDTRALDDIATQFEELVRRRDQALQELAQRHLEVEIPVRAEELLRQGDFAGAERVWRDGLHDFFDGLRRPSLDKVPAPMRVDLENRYERAREAGMAQLEVAERRAADALRNEAAQGTAALRADSASTDSSPRSFVERLAALSRLRQQLEAAYPVSAQFRPAVDPWQQVLSMVVAMERELQARFEAAERLHDEEMLGLAWRAFLDGSPEAGLGVLASCSSRGTDERDWIEPHREAMAAAAAFAKAVGRELAALPAPVTAYPRNGGLPVELRALADGSIEARIGAGGWRSAQLTEFRFEDLWRRVLESAPQALQSLPVRQLGMGLATFAMACDQLDSMPSELGERDRAFLRDEVWPRLLEVRMRAPGSGQDRADALLRLREAYAGAREARDTVSVQSALAQWEAGYALKASDAERAVASEVRDWVQRETKRQRLLVEISRRAPDGAQVEVQDADPMRATVFVPASSIRAAGEGWRLHGGRMEHAGQPQDWASVLRRKLEVDPGIPDGSHEAVIDCEFALPESAGRQSAQVFEFQGLAFVLFTVGDGSLRSGLVQGLDRGDVAIREAIQRAIHAGLDRSVPGPKVIPGALHGLRITIHTTPARRNATLLVHVDGIEVSRSIVERAGAAPARFVVYPMQDLAIRNLRVAASD